MPNLIACRITSYAKFQEQAWSHLNNIGIKHVEIHIPSPAEQTNIQKKLKNHSLIASSMQAKCDISNDNVLDQMRPQLHTCARFGAKICLICISAGKTPKQLIYNRLRKIGDLAANLKITVTIENHPDLMTNAEITLQTINAVNHPNIRANFDTANVYYYNKNLNAIDELKILIDYVDSMHLKDSNGIYQAWDFPTLGTGVVDFPAVFQIAKKHSFNGPFTIELQGTKGLERNEQQQLQYVAQSVAYLKNINAFKN